MKLNVKNLAGIAAVALMIVAAAGLRGCVRVYDSHKLCESLDVQVKGGVEFVSEEDVRSFLDKNYGCYIGVRLDSLDLGRIEELLGTKKVLVGSEAWTTRDGVLHVAVEQRAPALRFQRGSEGFYMDAEGFTFPLHPSYTAPVPLIEGAIPPIEKGERPEWAAGILELSALVSDSPRWAERIERISVSRGGDVELKAVSGERFIIGEPVRLADKLGRLEKYYTHIIPAMGEKYYKSVNVKYNKQIICRKDT